MLYNQSRRQGLLQPHRTNFPQHEGLGRRILMKAAALAALLTLTTGPTAAADHPTTANSAPTLAATPAHPQPPAQPVDPTVTTPPASPPPAGTDAQAPVTVTQPPGVSGFIPIHYLLPLLLALLIAFLAGRPGGQEAAKNLLRLLRIGGGGGNTPPAP